MKKLIADIIKYWNIIKYIFDFIDELVRIFGGKEEAKEFLIAMKDGMKKSRIKNGRERCCEKMNLYLRQVSGD